MSFETIPNNEEIETTKKEKRNKEKLELSNLDPIWTWKNTRWGFVLILSYIHLQFIKFTWILLSGQTTWKHLLFQSVYGYMGALGIVAGAHRLWSHKCYKAKLPLKIILVIFNSIAGQTSIWRWCKDHRLHHKFSETNADPHNARRGFFFSHVGWLLLPEHKMVQKKFKTIDMSDLESDPIVMFQYRHYTVLVALFCFILPTWISSFYFGETLWTAWAGTLFRYAININAVFFINSWAHLWGSRPYDKNIGPTESKSLSILTLGEGWHNYHHTFPWDYKAAELGQYRYNYCTAFIDFFAIIGWAYELKTVPWKIVRDRIIRTGDRSYNNYKHYFGKNKMSEGFFNNYEKENRNENEVKTHTSGPWGWGDADIPQEDIQITQFM